jgi:hypothetical protein
MSNRKTAPASPSGMPFAQTLEQMSGNMSEGLDFVRRLWSLGASGGMGAFPGLPSVGNIAQFAQALPRRLPSMMTPTLDVEELDRRIADLRAVEQWLDLNLSMLRTNIQAMEVQRNTIATLKSFSGTMLSSMAAGMNEAVRKDEEASARTGEQDKPPAAREPEATPEARAEDGTAAAPLPEAASSALPVNPMAWWGALQDQFSRVATAAAQAAAAANPPPRAAAAGKNARKRAGGRTRKAKSGPAA